MASTALEIAAARPIPFWARAPEVQFACCARFSSHRFRPAALRTWPSLFFMDRRAIHRIFHDRNSSHPQCDYPRRNRSQRAAHIISKFVRSVRTDQEMLDDEAGRRYAKEGWTDKCFHVTQPAAHRISNETSTNNQPFQPCRVCCGQSHRQRGREGFCKKDKRSGLRDGVNNEREEVGVIKETVCGKPDDSGVQT